MILHGYDVEVCHLVATGYGRVSVEYANKVITEISCHANGVVNLFNVDDAIVIDIGGQDTKIIYIKDGRVSDFLMNDKCSAGTGRFLEVMANSLGKSPEEVCELASNGGGTKISSMCTVFAESEIISLAGKGEDKCNIAFAIVDSITEKVVSQASKFKDCSDNVFLTGGLCKCDYLVDALSQKLGKKVITNNDAIYTGALGAAIYASEI